MEKLLERWHNYQTSKYYHWLCLICLTLYLTTFLLAYKMTYFYGHIISCGIFVFPITFIITDIITEIYGITAARNFIKQAIVCEFVFSLLLFGLAQLPSPPMVSNQESYHLVLGSVLRFCASNVAGVVIGQYLNIYIISRWCILVKGRYFWLRSIGASLVGEFFTSLIADISAFFGNYSWAEISDIFFTIYIIKILYAFALAYPASYLVDLLRKNDPSIDEFSNSKFKPKNALSEIMRINNNAQLT